ncbi:unnamed protein product [Somion occarium]|uniref:Uncharacterized protein n=1 Tax=Somion occarium TaxID=3059160 RepID=A0ABP1CLF7_9APHY
MSKRQRPSSPIPISPETQLEDETSSGNVYEPDTKRRRYFAPITPGDRQSTSDGGDEYDSEDSELREGQSNSRRKYLGGLREWQADAGVYKDANILLHDLHAEQRHRMLFSTTSSTSTAFATHSHSPPSSPHYIHAAKDSISKPASYFSPTPGFNSAQPEQIETQTVTHRYEGSNRLLRSLFLNRRQGLQPRDQS